MVPELHAADKGASSHLTASLYSCHYPLFRRTIQSPSSGQS